MPSPEEIPENERGVVVQSSMSRIRDSGGEVAPMTDSAYVAREPYQSASPQDLWMLLLVRMITRASEDGDENDSADLRDENSMELVEANTFSRQDRIRQTLFDYTMTNFPARSVIIYLCFTTN